MEDLWLMPAFFVIAFLYSMVGFGGGSSYIAVFAVAGMETAVLRSTALLCNVTVVSGNAWVFLKKKFLHGRKTLPLVLTSIPFAFIGGVIRLDRSNYYGLLSITLVSAGLMMLVKKKEVEARERKGHWIQITGVASGAATGFLAGLVGIGGGVFLSPILYLLKWDKPKSIAATCSVFILFNSIAGLAGQIFGGNFKWGGMLTVGLLFAVFLGGQLGVRFTTHRLKPSLVKVFSALLIIIVGLKIFVSNYG